MLNHTILVKLEGYREMGKTRSSRNIVVYELGIMCLMPASVEMWKVLKEGKTLDPAQLLMLSF